MRRRDQFCAGRRQAVCIDAENRGGLRLPVKPIDVNLQIPHRSDALAHSEIQARPEVASLRQQLDEVGGVDPREVPPVRLTERASDPFDVKSLPVTFQEAAL